MKPAPFVYVRPDTVAAALEALVEHADAEPKILAGGQSLIPMMNFRVAQPGVLIDIGRIPGLALIEDRGADLAIGAMCRHAEVKASALVARHLPLVREAYGYVAHATIRNRGTIGGNLAHADPASEMPTAMMALDARFVIGTRTGYRIVEASEFFLGTYATAIDADELLIEILVPKQGEDEGYAFEEVSLRKGDFAMAAVAVRLSVEDGLCRAAHVVLAGVSDLPLRSTEAEAVLRGSGLDDATVVAGARAAVSAIAFNSTAWVSADYRRDLTHALIVRAVNRARTHAGSAA